MLDLGRRIGVATLPFLLISFSSLSLLCVFSTVEMRCAFKSWEQGPRPPRRQARGLIKRAFKSRGREKKERGGDQFWCSLHLWFLPNSSSSLLHAKGGFLNGKLAFRWEAGASWRCAYSRGSAKEDKVTTSFKDWGKDGGHWVLTQCGFIWDTTWVLLC